MTRNMQQEGVGLVLLPRPASLVRSPVLACVEAPLGESVVPLADTGAKNPPVLLCCWRTRGAKNPRVPLELMCWEGVEWRLVLRVLPVSAELLTRALLQVCCAWCLVFLCSLLPAPWPGLCNDKSNPSPPPVPPMDGWRVSSS